MPIVAGILILFAYYCLQKKENTPIVDLVRLKEAGVITAVTLYGSTTFFQYKMQSMGYEYELIKDFADRQGLRLNLIIVYNIQQLYGLLLSGEADVIAYPVQVDHRKEESFLYCGHKNLTTQVLVQRAGKSDTLLTDVTQLAGKEVCVNSGTRFAGRLNNLNREIGGGIIIKEMPHNAVNTEDLIEKVSRGEIRYTIADDNIAKLNKTYFWNIDASLPVSFIQQSSWAVRKSSPLLAEAIDKWAEDTSGKRVFEAVMKRYFELSKHPGEEVMPEIREGHISPYDSLFRQHASMLGWDWQLLASISYQESRFDPYTASWAGAEGIMGIMPSTAHALGFTPQDLKDPGNSIRISVEILRRFRQGFSEVEDPVEKMKFTLGAYNSGIGHIYDAQKLAEKYGKNPGIWDDNVADFVRLKSDPYYYNDPVCRYGYLRGSETFGYVGEVMKRYLYYKKRTG